MVVQVLAVDGAERPVFAWRKVHDNAMGVQLRVPGPAGEVFECGADKARYCLPFGSAMTTAGEGRMSLQVAQSRRDRRFMGFLNGKAGLLVRQPPQDTDRFGRRKCAVPTCTVHSGTTAAASEWLVGMGMQPLQYRSELGGLHGSAQTQAGRTLTSPNPERITTVAVVILPGAANAVVSGGCADAHGSDGHHGVDPLSLSPPGTGGRLVHRFGRGAKPTARAVG